MGTKGYLASVIFRTFEHVHGMTDLPKPIRHPAYLPGRKRAMTIHVEVAPNDARELVTVFYP
jgi:hypothetical protein